MKYCLLNAGFGSPLSQEDRSWIRGRGFHGVRSDYGPKVLLALYETEFLPLIILPRSDSHELLVDYFVAACREAIKLGYIHHRPYPMPAIEPLNEPDLDPYWGSRPDKLANAIWECWQLAAQFSSGLTVVTPGVSNLTKKGLDYLEAMVEAGIPGGVAVGFHRYPPVPDPTMPHDGFSDRWAEIARLRAIAGKRKLWCTETGYTSGPHKKARGFPLCFLQKNYWENELQVANHAVKELKFWARVPDLEVAVWYQIDDGDNTNNPEDNFGLRRYPSKENKILANAMPKLIKEVTNDET